MRKRILRLLALGDIHGMSNEFLSVLYDGFKHNPDAVLSVGDIGSDILGNLATFNKERESLYKIHTHSLLSAMALFEKPVIFVPGNHDHYDWPFGDGANNLVFNVDILSGGTTVAVNDVCVLGIGGSPSTDAFWFNEWESDNISVIPEVLQKWSNAQYRILLSHSPPYGSWLDIDITHTRFLGSKGVRNFLVSCEKKPHLFLCGHIHESQNVDFVSGTPAINLGPVCPSIIDAFDHSINKRAIDSFVSSQYWIIDMFRNKVKAKHYVNLGLITHEFMLRREFIFQAGKIFMKNGGVVWRLSASGEDMPVAKPNKVIERRHMKPEVASRSLNKEGKKKDIVGR